jgi:hypothetical protein
MDRRQGDQIWANFRPSGNCYLFENYKRSPNVGLLFNEVKFMSEFGQKNDWAMLWVIFSQTHLVTLIDDEVKILGNFFPLLFFSFILYFG